MKTILLTLLLTLNIFAKDNICNNTSTCVDSDYFTANIAKISKRGKTTIVQIKYTSKVRVNSFDADFKNGYALILDKNGNEFQVDGKNITGFSLRRKENRVLSLRFKGDITSPFDLIIKASREHGEITFFDLQEKI
jgi:hypothetical protein